MASKAQRKVNRTLKLFKRELRTDKYLQNRFWLRQIQNAKDQGVEYFRFEISDSITGDKLETHWFDQYSFDRAFTLTLPWKLYDICNDFIIKKLHPVERK